MRALSVLATAVFAVALLAMPRHLAPSSLGVLDRYRAAEVARLTAHFDSVDLELRQATTSMLSARQRALRSDLIAWLREYRDAGTFPENDRFPDRAMPSFRDSRGVLCAMAYLVARAGRTDIVDRIARTRNNAFIPELAGDTALARWLWRVGLSAEEAARIQPTYGPRREQRNGSGYAVLSAAASGAALTMTGFNILSPKRATGWLGVGTGALAGLVGLANIDAEGDTKTLALANIAVGLTTMVLSVRGFHAAPPEQRRPATDQRRGAHATVVPLLAMTTGVPRLGFVVRARF